MNSQPNRPPQVRSPQVRPPQVRSPQVEFWGIDGCKGGWFCFGLNRSGGWQALVAASMEDAWRDLERHAPRLILTDMPIGLPSGAAERACDRLARRFVGARRASIFPMPCRQAVARYQAAPPANAAAKRLRLEDAAACHRRHTGKGLSVQSLNLIPAIADMDSFVRAVPHAPIREMHPEVAFAALNGRRGLAHYKKTQRGERERLAVLRRPRPRPSLPQIWRRLKAHYPKRAAAPDDILDAMVGALTAWLTQRCRLQSLRAPQVEEPTMEPVMEIVFVVPPPQPPSQKMRAAGQKAGRQT